MLGSVVVQVLIKAISSKGAHRFNWVFRLGFLEMSDEGGNGHKLDDYEITKSDLPAGDPSHTFLVCLDSFQFSFLAVFAEFR